MGTSWKTVVQHHNQDISINTTYPSYSDCLSFMYSSVCVYVYWVLFSFITCVVSCIYHPSPETQQVHQDKEEETNY